MKKPKYLRETKRDFFAQKRRDMKKLKTALSEARTGCAVDYYFPDMSYRDAVHECTHAIDRMDAIIYQLSYRREKVQ